MESNYKKYASVKMVLLIKIKFQGSYSNSEKEFPEFSRFFFFPPREYKIVNTKFKTTLKPHLKFIF